MVSPLCRYFRQSKKKTKKIRAYVGGTTKEKARHVSKSSNQHNVKKNANKSDDDLSDDDDGTEANEDGKKNLKLADNPSGSEGENDSSSGSQVDDDSKTGEDSAEDKEEPKDMAGVNSFNDTLFDDESVSSESSGGE